METKSSVDLAKVTDLELIAFRLQFEQEAAIVQQNLQAVWREFQNRVTAMNQKKTAEAVNDLVPAGKVTTREMPERTK